MGFLTGLILIGIPMGFLLGVLKARNQKAYLVTVSLIFAAALTVSLLTQPETVNNLSESMGAGLGAFIGHLLGEFAYNDAVK